MPTASANIETTAQAAQALKPIAGDLAFVLFALGILGTGLLALPVLAGSAAEAVASYFRLRKGLDLTLARGRSFYAILAAAMLLGAGHQPVGAEPDLGAVLGGGDQRRHLGAGDGRGDDRGGRVRRSWPDGAAAQWRLLGWLATAAMAAASVALGWSRSRSGRGRRRIFIQPHGRPPLLFPPPRHSRSRSAHSAPSPPMPATSTCASCRPRVARKASGHRLVQSRRSLDYESEVGLSARFGRPLVRGRADGWDPRRRRVEEIKIFIAATSAASRPVHFALHSTPGPQLRMDACASATRCRRSTSRWCDSAPKGNGARGESNT